MAKTVAILFPSLLAAASTLAVAAAPTPRSQSIDFNRDIRPILSNKCFLCHGPDESNRKAKLRLDNREGATSDLGGYAAVVPGKPDQSELITRITAEDDPSLRMPPAKFGKPLTSGEIKLLSAWIRDGAPYAKHWAYERPAKPTPPSVKRTSLIRTPIDRFLLERLEREGLTFSPEADPSSIARRVALDLTGLPPTPDEIQDFLADPAPNSYERFVDRILAKPSYGEHWARLWLDLARYADSAGYADDPPRTIWAYRDYVIRSFNANKPFDQFTIEQIAGDLLPNPTNDQLIATAFHRNTMTNSEGGTNDEEFRNVAVVDRVNTTWTVWMGTSMACAQCHNHKYDPITQRDYFRSFAIFNNTQDADLKDESPVLKLETPDRKPYTTVPIQRELPADKRRKTRLQRRGNFEDLGEEITSGVPDVLPPIGSGTINRASFARWLVSSENPLTARVVVNRYWEQIFGTGLVRTGEEFGSQGELPSHPELLDWLAAELMDRKWDVKLLLRLLVTSAGYRQTTKVSRDLLERDPENRLYARGPRFRISAEVVRDQALFVSGLLSPKMYGPPVNPPRPSTGLKAAFGSAIDRKTSEGGERYRRGLYTEWRRSNPYPSMLTFDAPNRDICTVRRNRTNTPLQALVTLNDPVYVEAAQALARRLTSEASTPEGRARLGFRLCLAREATDNEVSRTVALFKEAQADYAANPKEAARMATAPLGPAPDGSNHVDLAAWTVVSNVLLNLDEFFLKR